MNKIVESIKEKWKNADKYNLLLCIVSVLAGMVYLSVTIWAKPAGDDCMALPTEYYNISHTPWIMSIQKYLKEIVSDFKLGSMRFFPFLFPASFIRSWFKVSTGVYRLYIAVYTYLDIVILSYFIGRVLKNKSVGRAVLCIMPFLIGIWSQIDTNAMYSYEALVQATLFPMLLSGLCLVRWSDTQKKRYIVFGGLLAFYSCATYELGFILIIPVWGLIWIYENDLKKSFKVISPAVVGEIAALAINFLCRYVHRMESTQGVAYGVQFSFNIKNMVQTFIYQLESGIPLIGMRINHVNFGKASFVDVIVSIILAFIAVAIVRELKSMTQKSNILLFLVGLSLFSGPAGLVSLSVKFQEYVWVNENYGYIPSVIQQFGFGIMIIAVFAAVIKWMDIKKLCWLKKVMMICMAAVFITLGIYQRSAARERNKEGYIEYKWCIQSIEAGLLDRGHEDAIYISFREVWGASNAAQQMFVKRYTEKNMNIISAENWDGMNATQNNIYMYGEHMNELNNIPVSWIGEAINSEAKAMKNVVLYVPNNIEDNALLQYEIIMPNKEKALISVPVDTLKAEYTDNGIWIYLDSENIVPDIFRIIEE